MIYKMGYDRAQPTNKKGSCPIMGVAKTVL